MKTSKNYSVTVTDSNNDGVYIIKACSKKDAIRKVSFEYNTKTQSGTTYYVKEA
jgi:hypothetical protein